MLTHEETTMRWLKAYTPLAAAIAVLGCCLLAGLPSRDSKSGQESHISSGTVNSDAGSRSEQSNTAFLVNALRSCGNGGDDEAVQRALAFVSRCQNQQIGHNAPP